MLPPPAPPENGKEKCCICLSLRKCAHIKKHQEKDGTQLCGPVSICVPCISEMCVKFHGDKQTGSGQLICPICRASLGTKRRALEEGAEATRWSVIADTPQVHWKPVHENAMQRAMRERNTSELRRLWQADNPQGVLPDTAGTPACSEDDAAPDQATAGLRARAAGRRGRLKRPARTATPDGHERSEASDDQPSEAVPAALQDSDVSDIGVNSLNVADDSSHVIHSANDESATQPTQTGQSELNVLELVGTEHAGPQGVHGGASGSGSHLPVSMVSEEAGNTSPDATLLPGESNVQSKGPQRSTGPQRLIASPCRGALAKQNRAKPQQTEEPPAEGRTLSLADLYNTHVIRSRFASKKAPVEPIEDSHASSCSLISPPEAEEEEVQLEPTEDLNASSCSFVDPLEAEEEQAEEETRQKSEEEAQHEAAEEAQRKAEEEAQRKTEKEIQRKAEEEAQSKIEEAQQKAEEEVRWKAEEQARRKDKEEARRKLEEEARQKAEEEAQREAAEEAQRKAEDEIQRKAEEEARQKAEEEARKKAEEEARRKAEEQARRKAKEEARRKLEEEARQKAEEKARREAAEEAQRKAEKEIQRKAEEESRQKAEEEARQKAEEEARQKAEEQARRKAKEEARRKLEQELQLKAEEEEQVRLKAVEDARLKIEAETKLKAEEDARLQAELNAQPRAQEAAAESEAEEEEDQRKREAPPAPLTPPSPPVGACWSNGAPRLPPPLPSKQLTVPSTTNMQTDVSKTTTPAKKATPKSAASFMEPMDASQKSAESAGEESLLKRIKHRLQHANSSSSSENATTNHTNLQTSVTGHNRTVQSDEQTARIEHKESMEEGKACKKNRGTGMGKQEPTQRGGQSRRRVRPTILKQAGQSEVVEVQPAENPSVALHGEAIQKAVPATENASAARHGEAIQKAEERILAMRADIQQFGRMLAGEACAAKLPDVASVSPEAVSVASVASSGNTDADTEAFADACPAIPCSPAAGSTSLPSENLEASNSPRHGDLTAVAMPTPAGKVMHEVAAPNQAVPSSDDNKRAPLESKQPNVQPQTRLALQSFDDSSPDIFQQTECVTAATSVQKPSVEVESVVSLVTSANTHADAEVSMGVGHAAATALVAPGPFMEVQDTPGQHEQRRIAMPASAGTVPREEAALDQTPRFTSDARRAPLKSKGPRVQAKRVQRCRKSSSSMSQSERLISETPARKPAVAQATAHTWKIHRDARKVCATGLLQVGGPKTTFQVTSQHAGGSLDEAERIVKACVKCINSGASGEEWTRLRAQLCAAACCRVISSPAIARPLLTPAMAVTARRKEQAPQHRVEQGSSSSATFPFDDLQRSTASDLPHAQSVAVAEQQEPPPSVQEKCVQVVESLSPSTPGHKCALRASSQGCMATPQSSHKSAVWDPYLEEVPSLTEEPATPAADLQREYQRLRDLAAQAAEEARRQEDLQQRECQRLREQAARAEEEARRLADEGQRKVQQLRSKCKQLEERVSKAQSRVGSAAASSRDGRTETQTTPTAPPQPLKVKGGGERRSFQAGTLQKLRKRKSVRVSFGCGTDDRALLMRIKQRLRLAGPSAHANKPDVTEEQTCNPLHKAEDAVASPGVTCVADSPDAPVASLGVTCIADSPDAPAATSVAAAAIATAERDADLPGASGLDIFDDNTPGVQACEVLQDVHLSRPQQIEDFSAGLENQDPNIWTESEAQRCKSPGMVLNKRGHCEEQVEAAKHQQGCLGILVPLASSAQPSAPTPQSDQLEVLAMPRSSERLDKAVPGGVPSKRKRNTKEQAGNTKRKRRRLPDDDEERLLDAKTRPLAPPEGQSLQPMRKSVSGSRRGSSSRLMQHKVHRGSISRMRSSKNAASSPSHSVPMMARATPESTTLTRLRLLCRAYGDKSDR